MNARLDSILDEARALSAEEQEELADLIEAYIANHAEAPDAPEAEVREFFARHRG